MSRRFAAGGLALAATLVVAACGPTTYDSSVETTVSAVATPSTLPTGSAEELLPVMLDEVGALSQRVAESDGDGAAATRIEQLWASIQPEVAAERPELVSDFEFVVRRCRAAADRNRPADADRAFKNLGSLVEAFLA